ncbi:hypothetical protein AR9_g283 [Bacillus phage AR9]|uniref:Uncharacterized protein n=1 Tax=Bacillus phage AR9 TaxID=1815509 RepID=A0A172JIJ4_BPPB1|nr:hypothetical protein BI022_gp282 [Bacillus phage AR9]AMS01367.1 hypothetical protein AR9_g283 [Bacillus phage AR9]
MNNYKIGQWVVIHVIKGFHQEYVDAEIMDIYGNLIALCDKKGRKFIVKPDAITGLTMNKRA